MKSKKLLLALALPMAFAACSNEELIENGTAPSNNNLVELGDNFVLSVQGAAGTTRGVWEVDGNLKWSWIPEILADGTGANSMLGKLNVATDEIGLCWTGELPDGTGSISSNVYTNYQFLHDGWLAEGEDAVEFDNCTQALKNGALYSNINVGSLNNKSALSEIKAQLKDASNYVNGQPLNLNTGIFKTSNKAIFGGSYIAYYPYNENFVDAGSLPVVSKVVFDNVKEGNVSAAHVAKNSVLVGYAKNLIGGSQASKFSMDPLSGIISLQIKGTSKEIEKIALWSEDGFVTSVNLDASKIKNNGAAAGEALYVSGSKQTNATIVADLKDNVTLSDAAVKRFYFPVLPTTVNNLKVVLYASDNSVAVIEAGNYTIGAAEGVKVAVNAKATDFVANAKVAVDNDSFNAAIANEGTAKDPIKVTVIGDITLTADATIPAYVTVEGDKIIVPEGKTLTLADNSTIKSDVVVEGKGCCSAASVKGGILAVEGATIGGNVTVEAGEATPVAAGTINFTKSGAIVANTAVIETVGQVNFTTNAKDVVINGTLTLSEDAVAEVAEGAVVAVKGGTINNNGTFEVKGDFSMLDASGSTVAEAGENFVNNGTFIDNVGAIVGGATQYMVFGEKGDYICKVDGVERMNEAYENKTACSTIEIISNSRITYTFDKIKQHHEKDVNIVVSGSNVTFEPAKAITIGNLTVSKNKYYELYIKTSNTTNTITVNGDITIGAVFYTETDVRNMKAKNLTVVEGGKATFKNRDKSQDKTLEVSGTIEVQKGGTFTIKPAEVGQNTAYVTCTKLIEGGTFNGKPIVVRN
ncbi:hypothetical protein [uncultured Bacteroides sp.]|uniref:hypothetical protein n=1 Tax=uncultured Bacteroides sp. TaxID=162156 RepID=UPI00261C2977|nr:hypothetical protein [uncultured Bacteroides sp.]